MNDLHTIFLGLGTNIGDRKGNIEKAIELLQKEITNIKIAPLYESKPQGYDNQGNFLNSAVTGKTKLSLDELLFFVKDIEWKLGRREGIRNGPREIDIDILFYNNLILNSPLITIPHPRIQDRDFVLQPLVDLAPDFIHPTLTVSLKELLYNLGPDKYFVISVFP